LTVRIFAVLPTCHLNVTAIRMRFVITSVSRRFSATIRRKVQCCLDTITRIFKKVVRFRSTSKSIRPSASWWIAFSRNQEERMIGVHTNINRRILIQEIKKPLPTYSVDWFLLFVCVLEHVKFYIPESMKMTLGLLDNLH
jgi:hypothetical protein